MTPVLSLHLLGPFQAFDQDRPLNAFATDKARALLVYLAMEADIPHRRESLATLLFPEWGDKEAGDNLRRTLHRLRSALNEWEPSRSDTLLTITRTTIQLNSSALLLDAARFRQVMMRGWGKSRLAVEDIEQLATMVALYRGEFTAGLAVEDAQPFEEWLLLQRLAFHQQALNLCDLLTAAYEEQGQFPTAQQYARQALALEPWREEAHYQLIRLLALNGQKSEALTQFERCCHLLAEEMGMDPSPETVALVKQIRNGQFRPAPAHPTATARPRLHRFPAQFTSFVGREGELQTIVGQLLHPDCRLVTLVGAGGMGKTRLSVQAAQRLAQNESKPFAEGLYFVDCAPLIRVEDLPSTLAMAVGLSLQGGSAATEQIHAFLRAKSVLLVLDNVEQIIGCALDVAALLEACPQVKVLVTSREPLRLRAEWRYDIEGLDTRGGMNSKAAHLFVQRARQLLANFTPSGAEEYAIQQIVQWVGGHPLAIELAATWLRFYDCATIAEEISKGIDFLESHLQDLPARHRSIRVLFDHSWQLLTPAEQKMLRHLSVLRGEWTLAQGTAVADGSPRELAKLSDKSLIRRTHAGRYAIDELIRQFASEQMTHEREDIEVRRRCAHFFLQSLARHHSALHGMEPQAAIAAIRADWVNIRHAWGMGIALRMWEAVATAAEVYQMFVALTGLVTDGLTDFQLLLDALPNRDEAMALQAMAHAYMAGWCFQRSQYSNAYEHTGAVLRLPDNPAVMRWRGYAGYVQAQCDLVQGRDVNGVMVLVAEVERAFKASGDPLGNAHATALRAMGLQKQGALEAANATDESTLAQFERIGYPLGIIQTLNRIAVNYRSNARFEESLAFHLRSRELMKNFNSPAELARHHNNVGALYRSLNQYEKAIDNFTRAVEIDELLGHQRGVAIEKGNIGLIYQQTYRYEAALAFLKESIEIARANSLKGIEANYLACRGELYAELGQFDLAYEGLAGGIALAHAIQNHGLASTYLGSFAWVSFRCGEGGAAFIKMEEALAEQRRFQRRESLAESLHHKGVMLMETGDLPAAFDTAAEAIALRTDIGLAGLSFLKSRILYARLQGWLGQRREAIAALHSWRNEATEGEAEAELLFGLWDVSRTEAYRHAAAEAIAALPAQAQRYECQQRLALLRGG